MVWFSAANGRCGFSSALSPCSKFSITGFFSSCLWVIWERWICHFVMRFAMPGPARHGLPLAYSSRGMSCAINVPQAITRTPLSAEKNGRTVFRAGGQHAHGCDLRLARLGACARGRHAEVGVRVHSGMLRRWRPGPRRLQSLTDTIMQNPDTELGFSLQDSSEPLSYQNARGGPLRGQEFPKPLWPRNSLWACPPQSGRH